LPNGKDGQAIGPPDVLPERNPALQWIERLIEEAFMRAIPIAAIMLAGMILSSNPARADGTWCAQYGTGFSGKNCGFYSFEQCRASLSGIGGFCQRNTFSANVTESRRRYRRDN
jgi:hypothetical protein